MNKLPRRTSLFLLMIAVPAMALGADSNSLLGMEQLIEFALALAAVVAFIYVLAFLLRRMQAGVQGQGSLKILQGLQVGPKEKLLLVQVEQEVLLLGVGGGGVQKLHQLDSLPIDAVQDAAELMS